MRNTILLLAFIIFCGYSLQAQEEVKPEGDTTVYTALVEMPRFPACEQLDTTIQAKNQCAQQQLLAFMYNNIVYPMEARQEGYEGTVVASFIVEKDGSLSNAEILKDIGGGAGLEVLRVIEGMNQAEIRWVPGKKEGEPVRARFNFPVKFKLEEVLPYTILGRDTVYSQFETPLAFKGGAEALENYLTEKLKYPESGLDSCQMGVIELQILIRPGGEVRILDMVDYNNLGFDFWYAATDAVTSTYGMWQPATYEGRPVTASYSLSLPFLPEDASCQDELENYKAAHELAGEASQLLAEEDAAKKEEGIEKLTRALEMLPDNANFLIMRGEAYMDMQRFDEACEDLTRAREIALINWYDGVLPMLCR